MFDMVLLQRASLRQGTHKKLKTVLKLLVVEENHGVKKVQVELDKVQHVLHNGEVEEFVFGPTPRSYKFKLNRVRRLV